jgi:hypothetical protein
VAIRDRDAIKSTGKPTAVIIIESPHKNEYFDGNNFAPIGPAQGCTGDNINKYLELIFNKYISKDLSSPPKHKCFNVIITNPVQFQASLFQIHNRPLSYPGVASLRNKVWLKLFELECKEFERRMLLYKPSVIINACTSKFKKHINRFLDENKFAPASLLYEADRHPSFWSTKSILKKIN